MIAHRDPSRTLYSARVRWGPNIRHYDIYFGDEGIEFIYLGEYWEKFRPRTHLQQRMDMLIYSLRKKRRRTSDVKEPYDFTVKYSDIVRYELIRPQPTSTDSRTSRAARGSEEVKPVVVLVLVLRDGRRLEIEFPSKLYKLVKTMVKNYLASQIPGEEKVMRAR